MIVNIDVPSLEAGIAFYTEGLGFSLRRTLFGGSVAELDRAGAIAHLIAVRAGTAAFGGGPPRTFERHWTPVHVDFLTEDLDDTLARAIAAGATGLGALSDETWGRHVSMADPFGHGFCLIELSKRGYDAVAD